MIPGGFAAWSPVSFSTSCLPEGGAGGCPLGRRLTSSPDHQPGLGAGRPNQRDGQRAISFATEDTRKPLRSPRAVSTEGTQEKDKKTPLRSSSLWAIPPILLIMARGAVRK